VVDFKNPSPHEEEAPKHLAMEEVKKIEEGP
jgi:hypothetical protein